MPEYKLPICWLGQKTQPDNVAITEDMVNMKCRCRNALQAHFCMEGHMTECHIGMSCDEAECSHWLSEEDQEAYQKDDAYYEDDAIWDEGED